MKNIFKLIILLILSMGTSICLLATMDLVVALATYEYEVMTPILKLSVGFEVLALVVLLTVWFAFMFMQVWRTSFVKEEVVEKEYVPHVVVNPVTNKEHFVSNWRKRKSHNSLIRKSKL